MALTIPGEYAELSFAAWVKLDRFDFSHSAIFNSDGWDQGDIHWQIHRSGPIKMGYNGARGRHARATRLVSLDQWIHVVGTISQRTQKVCVYLNGELASSITTDATTPLRPGRGRIGGWLMEAEWDRTPIRSLRGKMDEFAIWKRALTDTEVNSLVEAGKPAVLWARGGITQ